MGQLLVALLAPGVEIVGSRRLQPLRINRIGTGQLQGLSIVEFLPVPSGAGDVGKVAVIGENRGPVGRINVYPHVA
jgi:hypothetical protein